MTDEPKITAGSTEYEMVRNSFNSSTFNTHTWKVKHFKVSTGMLVKKKPGSALGSCSENREN